ncbi:MULTISPECIES: hypothetical protein [unclassified Gilliamella]|uniref:hypothetical protein n=1 Tax=unclassified Gilliamella TaxID=2685620 RepID=UPI00226A8460|nr:MULTISPECIES: hypothetical protein [unclassified Gilliamella]MCX8641502.1 hypothetical protein [Gilliamella sp. B3835]MCX8720106.1 hypothetical protein [Gilliamella sp. B3788]
MPVYGLSSQTAKSINGSSPYLSFDNGKSASSTILPLLSITLPKNKVISALEDSSSATDPIMIDKVSSTFSDIVTNMPFANYPSTTLANVVVTNNYWHDPDGDKLFTITGNMQIKWENAAGEDVTNYVKSNPNSELDACKSPYKLTLSADAGSLATNYGIPSIGSFTGGSHSYYLYPSTPKVCYVQPNLYQGKGIQAGDEYEGGNYAGPVTQWDPDRGFKPQDLKNPLSNFPTTGTNNYFFKMTIAGLTAGQFISINGAQIMPSSGSGVNLSITAENNNINGNVVRVTLKGPTLTSANNNFISSIFKFYGDSAKSKIIYQFNLSRWFIVKPGIKGVDYINNYSDAVQFCRNLGSNYRMPSLQDYTNANTSQYHFNLGVPGQGNVYQRSISYRNGSTGKWVGGFFNEWGAIAAGTWMGDSYYSDSGWAIGNYWVSDVNTINGVKYNYNIFSEFGDIDPFGNGRVACVTP